MRAGALSDPKVGAYLNEHFVSAWERVGTFTAIRKDGKTVARQGGNVAVYFCTPDREVVHALAGPVSSGRFLASAKWAVETYRKSVEAANGDREALAAALRKAHAERAKSAGTCGDVMTFTLSASPVSGCAPEVQAARIVEGVKLLHRPMAPGACEGDVTPDCEPRTPAKLEAVRPPACPDEPATQIVKATTMLRPCDPVISNRALVLTRLLPQGDLHSLLAERGLPKLDEIHRRVFQNVLGQRLTNEPVQVRELWAGPAVTSLGEMKMLREELNKAQQRIEQLQRQIEELKQSREREVF